jgi:hypothetical protein
MSLPEPAADTEAQQILAGLQYLSDRIDVMVDALNGLGANQQWIVDNVKQIFEMFGSPAFLGQMSAMMGGINAGSAAVFESTTDGPAAESAE